MGELWGPLVADLIRYFFRPAFGDIFTWGKLVNLSSQLFGIYYAFYPNIPVFCHLFCKRDAKVEVKSERVAVRSQTLDRGTVPHCITFCTVEWFGSLCSVNKAEQRHCLDKVLYQVCLQPLYRVDNIHSFNRETHTCLATGMSRNFIQLICLNMPKIVRVDLLHIFVLK